MQSKVRTLNSTGTVKLQVSNAGWIYVAFMIVEAILLGGWTIHWGAVTGFSWVLLLPVSTTLVVLAWTWAMIEPDFQLSIDLDTRKAVLVSHDPLAGRRELARISRDEIEWIGLTRVDDAEEAYNHVVEVQFRSGRRQALSIAGRRSTYDEAVQAFCQATGIQLRYG